MASMYHILVGLALVHADHFSFRTDMDGEILSTAVLKMEKRLRTDQHVLHESEREKHGITKKFLTSFLKAFLPPAHSRTTALRDSIDELVLASVEGAKNDCGICFALLGFFRSVRISPEFEEPYGLVDDFNSVDVEDFKSLEHFMYTAAANHGSTWGILARFQLDILHETDPVRLCRMYEASLGHLAQESVVSDISSALMGPSDLDFASNKPPIYFMTPSDIQVDDERFGYIARMMRDNADFLQSSILLSPTDLVGMMGFDGEFTEEDISQSMEGLSSMTDDDIATEIIEAIHTDMYNTNVFAFNNALELIERDAESCLEGLFVFREIIQKHNLFIKVIFFLVKANWYRHRDSERTLLLSLLLSSVGVLPGTLNAIKLLELIGVELKPQAVNGKIQFRPPALGLSCSQPPIYREQAQMAANCLAFCGQDPKCRFSTFDSTTRLCSGYNACHFVRDRSSVELSERIDTTLSFLGCWPDDNRGSDCLRTLNFISATIHNHTESIHRLLRESYDTGYLDASLYWATRSAGIGAAEGKFYQGLLEQREWPGHGANPSEALAIFWRMLQDSYESWPITVAVREPRADQLDALEHEAILEISVSLGLPDYEIGHRPQNQSRWPQRLAATIGLARTYLEQNIHLFRKLVTLAGIIPVFIFLISRRAILVH